MQISAGRAGQRAGQLHPLAHAAGQLARAAARRSRRGRPARATRRRRGAARRAATPCSASGSSTLRRAVRHGSSASSWKTRARSASRPPTASRRRRRSARPAAGSRPARARSRVDLPQPEGPSDDQDLAGRHVEVDALDDRLAGVAQRERLGADRRRRTPGRTVRRAVAAMRGHAVAPVPRRGSQRVSRRPSSSTQPEVSQPSTPMVIMPTKHAGVVDDRVGLPGAVADAELAGDHLRGDHADPRHAHADRQPAEDAGQDARAAPRSRSTCRRPPPIVQHGVLPHGRQRPHGVPGADQDREERRGEGDEDDALLVGGEQQDRHRHQRDRRDRPHHLEQRLQHVGEPAASGRAAMPSADPERPRRARSR